MSENENNKKLKVVKNPEIEKESARTEEDKICTNDCMPAPPSTIYQVIMARMTPEQLAGLGVQLIQVNGSELFWLTSIGQLYPFSNKQAALEAEHAWLMSKPS